MQALWMIAGSFFFATMAVCVKFASQWFHSSELVFWRGVLGMLLLWAIARYQRQSLATRYPAMHAWRSLVGVISLGAWFYSIGFLPLATSMTLNYMSSVWVAAFLIGGALMNWDPRQAGGSPLRQGALVLTVLAGFTGVILMLRPTIAQNQLFAGLIGLMSGLTAAFAYMQVMALGKAGEPETRTVFYFAMGSAVGGALGMLVEGMSPWNWAHAMWLVPIAVLAALGQLCMTRAYSKGPTLVVASLQYFGLVFGAIYSVTLFGDAITLLGWAGMALIVASGIAATVLRSRAAPNAPAEEH
ncbi:EamA/RhaT family transporter [Caenimonas koreensis DSM 17982]|uniref:EamA/RhaT family transporter n=1 Tax=Caenimonas koreensis DSM 17982 TaxID=1121255 RepID=A0A844AXP8_9BURK|nr:DMT family transporter [Caenimonas koreensis]MRD49320.1 EamA/RhaT family transporter [Caenimonas koreensis DSM 17982]